MKISLCALAAIAVLETTTTAEGACVASTNVAVKSAGKILRHPEVVPILWGNWHTTDVAAFEAKAVDLLDGPYTTRLREYSDASGLSVSAAKLAPTVDVNSRYAPQAMGGNPNWCTLNGAHAQGPNWVTSADVQSMIVCEIINGYVPAPVLGVDTIYIVVYPPGFINSAHPGMGGQHQHFDAYNNERFYYAWVDNADITAFSHELAEAITDPDEDADLSPEVPNTSIPAGDDHEISDVCCGLEASAPWYSVAKYYSPLQRSCVANTRWSNVTQYAGSGKWISSNRAARHLAAGGWGAAMVDATSEHVFLMPGSVGGWVDTGPLPALGTITSYVAKLVVTDEAAYAVDANGFLWRATSPTSGWVWSGGPPLDDVFLFGGASPRGGTWGSSLGVGLVAVTNGHGLVRWTGTYQETPLGGPPSVSAVAVSNDGIYVIPSNRESVMYLANGSATWTTVLDYSPLYPIATVRELWGGIGNGVAFSFGFGSPLELVYYDPAGHLAYDQGAELWAHSLVGSPAAFGLFMLGTDGITYQSSNLTATKPARLSKGGSAQMMVGGGPTFGLNYSGSD